MSAAPPPAPKPAVKRAATPRLQHVVVHESQTIEGVYDEVVVFGQEIDALRHILGKAGWVYAAVSHGQPFTEALAVVKS